MTRLVHFCTWMGIAATSLCAAEPPQLTPKERSALSLRALLLQAEGSKLLADGKPAEARKRVEEVLKICRTLWPANEHPHGNAEIAGVLFNLAQVHRALSERDRAIDQCQEAIAMNRRAFPDDKHPHGHPATALMLHALAGMVEENGDSATALKHSQEALAMRRKLFPAATHPKGHADLIESLNFTAYCLGQMREFAKGLELAQEALAMARQLYPSSSHPNGHADLAQGLHNVGSQLAYLMRFREALPFLQDAAAMRDRLFPDGHAQVALSLRALGDCLRQLGELRAALQTGERAYAMRQKLYPQSQYPDGHHHLADSLGLLRSIWADLGDLTTAMAFAEQAVEMNRRLYPASRFPNGHAFLIDSLTDLGESLDRRSNYVRATACLDEAVAVARKLYPPNLYPNGNSRLARALSLLGDSHCHMGDYSRGLPLLEQALEMRRSLYPPETHPAGHHTIFGSLLDLGSLYERIRDFPKALIKLEQAVVMARRLYTGDRYPNGHLNLAVALNNLGHLLEEMRQYGKSLTYFEESLAIRRKLFPPEQFPAGHPALATGLHNLAHALTSKGDYARAWPYIEQALAMRRRLFPAQQYPNGHPQLAMSISNAGLLRKHMGDLAAAKQLFDESLAMRRRLYPRDRFPLGHSEILTGLHNLGLLHLTTGSPKDALPVLAEGVEMRRGHEERFIATASEGEALTFLGAGHLAFDAYQSASLQTPGPVDEHYAHVWRWKSQVTRVLQRRHQAVRTAGLKSEQDRKRWEELSRLRRSISNAVFQPRSDQRDRQLSEWTSAVERLERELAAALPEVEQSRKLAALGPKDLLAKLPADSAFVDFVYYQHIEKGKRDRMRFLAFVLTPNSGIQRLEIGDSETIEKVLKDWYEDILTRHDTPAQAAARLIWQPIARALPPGVRTVYISPDFWLAKVPWCALPGRQAGTVLLEDLTICVVPHGPFLLEQLVFPQRPPTSANVLVVGGIDYGPAQNGEGYPALPGTSFELRALSAAAGDRPVVALEGARATWDNVRRELSRAQYAHLATHGSFAWKALADELQRGNEALKNWTLDELRSTRLDAVGVRTALAYTWLALANANLSSSERLVGIVTGQEILELTLVDLRLVVLSACESALGGIRDGGNGMEGLQRAFHLAGCPNVIASLWKVNDAATAALMAKFYHELWVNKKPPLAALREAQLTIYRHPELIPDLAGERGAPKLKEAVAVKASVEPSGNLEKTADTKLWAAFVLSGVGK